MCNGNNDIHSKLLAETNNKKFFLQQNSCFGETLEQCILVVRDAEK